MFKTEIKDEFGNAVTDAEVELTYNDDSGKSVTVKAPSKIDDKGKVVAVVNLGKADAPKDVLVNVKKEGHAFASKVIKGNEIVEKITAPVLEIEKIEIAELEVGKAYTIKDVLYKSNSAALLPGSMVVLDGFSKYLLENEDIVIEIQGHTDNIGHDENNLALSKDRAFTVLEYLTSKGIKASRLSFKGYGESRPKFPNTTSANRAKNRRTDFKIVAF